MAAFQLALEHLVLGIVVLAMLVLLLLHRRAERLARTGEGHVLFFLGALVLPLVAGVGGLSKNMERATETGFCLSCHEMRPYGRSLYIDDDAALPASHFQNRRIPREEACYTCHKDYSLFGDLKSKAEGLRHVYVHFLGTVPDRMRLYRPFPNDNCLHCHAGMRSFDESKHHRTAEAPLADLYAGKRSCVTRGCHDSAHLVDELHELDFWEPRPPGRAEAKGAGTEAGPKPEAEATPKEDGP